MRPIRLLFLLPFCCVVAAPASAQGSGTMATVSAGALVWSDLNVPGFAPGAKLAVISGRPDTASAYTVRLMMPDGYRFPAHWHPMDENVTILEGSMQLAMGDRAEAGGEKSYGVGDYLYLPAKQPHYGGARGRTVVQLHGMGPFTINLANPPATPN